MYDFGLVHAAAVPASSLHVYVAVAELAWNVKVALVLVVPAGGVVSRNVSGLGANVYVCTSNVRPVESVGVTVTDPPLIVTLRKWWTWAGDVGSGAVPHFVPWLFVYDQPTAYWSLALHVPSDWAWPPPPPVT